MDLCRRRRNRLETCLKKQRNVDKKTMCFSAVELEKSLHRTRFFENTRTYEYYSSMAELKKKIGQSTRKNKSNVLEPHFPTSATKSPCLEDTKNAVFFSTL